MFATEPFGTWGPGPPSQSAGWFAAWLDHWQTLIAGAVSALAVAGVTLFVWRYEVWHAARQTERDKRRLARALRLEIETIADRVAAGRTLFDTALPQSLMFVMPEIARPFPVYSSHTRDVALFDDTTGKHVMMFYEGLPKYVDLRAYFETHKAVGGRLAGEGRIPSEERVLVRFSDSSLALAEQLETRLAAIAAGQEPPEWSDEWLKDKPYEPI
jgi:hypothetical protein